MDESYIDQEHEVAPKQPTVMKYGLIMGVVSIIVGLIIFYAGLIGNQAVSLVTYVIYIAFLFLAMREYKALNGGFMTFGQGLGVGFLTTLVSSLIGSVFWLIYLMFVDDSMLTTMIDQAMMQMQQNPAMNDEAMDAAMNVTKMFFTPIGFTLTALFSGLLTGTIISLIIAAIMKKNPE